jgi:hypothetical protein
LRWRQSSTARLGGHATRLISAESCTTKESIAILLAALFAGAAVAQTAAAAAPAAAAKPAEAPK